jgi:hypothetical protein
MGGERMRPGSYVSQQLVQQIAYTPYGNASGGTSSSITASGVGYTLLTFTSDGTLTVNRSGLFDLLLVGGGGAGGGFGCAGDGGGGGGGMRGGAGNGGGSGGSGIVYVRYRNNA